MTEQWSHLICTEKHKNADMQIGENRKDILDNKNKIDKVEKNLKDNISTAKESISSRLDEMNKVFIGEKESPGLFERERSRDKELVFIKWKIRICFSLMLFLVGSKIFGFTIGDIKDWFISEEKTVVNKFLNTDGKIDSNPMFYTIDPNIPSEEN